MEPKKGEYNASEHDSLYIDARFKDTQWIWTAEQYDASRAWSVYFNNGNCDYNIIVNDYTYVRAVR